MASETTSQLLRQAMRRFASGVTIVTLHDGHSDAGLTVSSFTSISLEPAIIMVAINSIGSVSSVLNEATSFAVHILGTEHEDLSVRFSASDTLSNKLGGIQTSRGETGALIIDAVPTVIEATVRTQVVVGSHHVTFGDVQVVRINDPAPARPLVYYDRDYRTVDHPGGGDDRAG